MDSPSTTEAAPVLAAAADASKTGLPVEADLPARPEGCPPPRSALRNVLGNIGFCLAVGVVLTAIMVPFWGLRWGIVAQTLIVNGVMSLGIGLSVSYLYQWVYPVLAGRVTGWAGRGLAHLAISGTAVFGGGEVGLRALGLIGFQVDQMRSVVFQIGLVVVAVVVGFSFAFERLKQQAREVELREHETRQMALRAQLDALQARTHPHFLFNSLNTVAGLIEEDPRTAERMLEKLSGVFRYALTGSKSSWVRLADELQAVRDYLAVEQIRFGERLQVSVDVESGVEHFLIPPLVLQPLVENAALHGAGSRPGPARISVAISRESTGLVLRVEDDGPGPGGSRHRGTGNSQDDLRERLALIYGERASFEAGAGPDGGYHAVLRLPAEDAKP